MEKIKPVVTEKIEIEYGDASKLLTQLESSADQNFEARMKTMHFFREFSCESFKFSIQTLLETIKAVVIEKYEFEFRKKNTLRILGLSGL